LQALRCDQQIVGEEAPEQPDPLLPGAGAEDGVDGPRQDGDGQFGFARPASVLAGRPEVLDVEHPA
jgi:hypothetical protein